MMTAEEFIQKSGAEVVGGTLIVGIMGERKVVGTYNDTFELNTAGQALLAELEGRAPKADVDTEAAPKKSRAKAE